MIDCQLLTHCVSKVFINIKHLSSQVQPEVRLTCFTLTTTTTIITTIYTITITRLVYLIHTYILHQIRTYSISQHTTYTYIYIFTYTTTTTTTTTTLIIIQIQVINMSQLMVVLPQQKSIILLFEQQDTLIQDSHLFIIGTLDGQVFRLRVYEDAKYNSSVLFNIRNTSPVIKPNMRKQNNSNNNNSNSNNRGGNGGAVWCTSVWYQEYPEHDVSIYGRLASSIAKDNHNYMLIMGCSNGNIYQICPQSQSQSQLKKIANVYYEQPNTCPILNITHSPSLNLIYALNLNSQLAIIAQQTMTLLNRINFGCDICSVTSVLISDHSPQFVSYLSSSRVNQSSFAMGGDEDTRRGIAVAYNNGLPPFLIDYQNIQQQCANQENNPKESMTEKQSEYYRENRLDIAQKILRNYQKMQVIYSIEQQSSLQGEQIYLMSKGHRANQLITANTVFIQQSYYICVYRLETPHFLSFPTQSAIKLKNIPLCYFLHLRIKLSLKPISLTQYNNFVFCSLWERMEIIDLNKRKVCCKIKNERQRWGHLLYVKDIMYVNMEDKVDGRARRKGKDQKQNDIPNSEMPKNDENEVDGERKFWILSAKGYNMWDIDKSRTSTVSLHFTKITGQLKFQ